MTIVADTRLGFYISKQAFQLFSTKYLFLRYLLFIDIGDLFPVCFHTDLSYSQPFAVRDYCKSINRSQVFVGNHGYV